MIAPWARKYIGIPFEPGGREPAGCDCYGLVCFVYREEFGATLPSYTGAYTPETPAATVEALVKNEADAAWAQVNDPAPGDVVLVRRLGRDSHVGLYVGDHKLLHCDRGTGAVIEDLRTGKWEAKIAAYYRFAGARVSKASASSNVLVTARKSPFTTHSALESFTPGMTIEEIVEAVSIPDYYRAGVAVRLDGGDIPAAWFGRIRPKAGHHVEIVIVPGGPLAEQLGLSTTTLRMGTMAGVSIAAGLISAAVGGPLGWAIGAALGIGGMLAVNALIPPPKLPTNETGYSFGGGASSVLRPFDPVPLVFGKHRVFPPLAAMPYTEIAGRDQYLHLLYLVGLGPVEISALKLGDEPIENYSDLEVEILRGAVGDPALTLYEGDIQEAYVNAKLEQTLDDVWNLKEGDGEGEYTAAALGWQTRTSATNPDRLSVDIAFIRGLMELKDGDPKEASVDFDIQARELPFGEWLAFNPFLDEDDYLGPAGAFTMSAAYSWMAILEGGFEMLVTKMGAMAAGHKAAPAAVLARVDYRLGLLSARLETLENIATGADLAKVQALQADIEAVRAAFALWAATTEAGTITAARNVINLTLDIYEAARSLAETVWNESKAGPVGRARSPWWRRWCQARWYRKAVVDLFNGPVYFGRGQTRWHRATDKYNGTVRISGAWSVDSDAGIAGGANQYEVRLRRRSKRTEDEDRTIYDEATWTALRTHRAGEAVTRDDVALVAFRIKATDQLNGMVSNFNCIAEAVTPYYDGADPVPAYSAWPTKISSNPAWAYLRLLCDPKVNARAVAVSRLDIERFSEWAAACEAATPPRAFDAYLTRKLTAFRLLGQIAATGRAVFGMRDGRFSIVRDVEQTTPIQHFTPRNSWGFEATRELIEKPHAIRCQFLNAEAGYEQDEIYVYADGFDANNATVFEDMEFSGITDAAAVHREARYHLAVAELRPEVIEFQTDIEHLVCSVGDLVLVTHDVPMWGLAAGRVKAISGTTVTLDEPVPMAAGKSYSIRFRLATGASLLRTVTTAAGLKSAVTVDSAPTGLAVGDLFMFGEAGAETRELIIKEIRPRGENEAEIKCVDHAPAVHTSDTEEIPDYDPGVTRPPVIELVRPPAPVIASVITDERALERDAYGTLRTCIFIEVRPPAKFTGPPPQYAEVEYRRQGAADWIRLPVQRADTGGIVIRDVQDKQTYDVRVRYTVIGITSAWTTQAGVYVIGKTSPPPAPSGLWLEGGKALRWAYETPPRDLKGFELRYAYGSSVVWSRAVHLHEGTLTGRAYTLPDNLRGTLTFEVRAVDVAGNYSKRGAALILGLGDRPAGNQIYRLDLKAGGWPGDFHNMEIGGDGVLSSTPDFWPDLYGPSDAEPFYGADDAALFYTAEFHAADYIFAFAPGASDIGGTLAISGTITGAAWGLEFREYNRHWPVDLSGDLWPVDLAGNLWPGDMQEWRPFQGELTIRDVLYEFRLSFAAGFYHSRVEALALTVDTVDREEIVEDVKLAGGYGRVPLSRPFAKIASVTVAIQSSPQNGLMVRIIDKNPAVGPLVEVCNAGGKRTAAIIDAVIRGY